MLFSILGEACDEVNPAKPFILFVCWCFEKDSTLPPTPVFVYMPLAPVKLLRKMLKCKEATTWEVITASLKLWSLQMRRERTSWLNDRTDNDQTPSHTGGNLLTGIVMVL